MKCGFSDMRGAAVEGVGAPRGSSLSCRLLICLSSRENGDSIDAAQDDSGVGPAVCPICERDKSGVEEVGGGWNDMSSFCAVWKVCPASESSCVSSVLGAEAMPCLSTAMLMLHVDPLG